MNTTEEVRQNDYNPLDGGVLDTDSNSKPIDHTGAFASLPVRALTGLVFVLVIVESLVHPIAFPIVFALFTGMITWEFTTIINAGLHLQVNRFITTVAAVYFFFAMYDMQVQLTGLGMAVFFPFVLTVMYLLISELYLPGYRKIENWAFAFMAFLYVALPMSLLNTMAFVNIGNYTITYTPVFTLSLFIFLWTSDTGAYLFGSKFGKHRLFPSVSPKKSWEGSIGGAVVAIIASQVVASFSHDFNANNMLVNRLLWAGMATTVVVFGTWGDLVESRLKRKLGVKDSGHILPGHGGWLDRFDSALMAIPAALIYIYFV